jgi:urease accessory protein
MGLRRASEVRGAGAGCAVEPIDRVVLAADERQRRRGAMTGEGGTEFLLDLAHAATLHDGDGLVLDDGAIVLVVAKPEPLLEIAAPTPHALPRLAWHIGNRHAEVQIVGGRLRIRRDHVLEQMLIGLGAQVTEIEAPFEPEPGAYEAHAVGHAHHRNPGEGP